MEDKHSCKVGEPGCPVAAVERGKQVIVGLNETMEVADHDFTRTSITPSVILHLDLPEDIEGSFYRGKVFVGLKEKCFEPSSPVGHVSELAKLLECQEKNKEILCLYTDGGLKLNKDMVVAVRTPPYSSWKDPAERLMSILNIGLQSIGLARRELQDKDLEQKLRRCNNMKQIRELAIREDNLKEEMKQSIQPVKDLVENVIKRLYI